MPACVDSGWLKWTISHRDSGPFAVDVTFSGRVHRLLIWFHSVFH